jgi:hypothetical protein
LCVGIEVIPLNPHALPAREHGQHFGPLLSEAISTRSTTFA